MDVVDYFKLIALTVCVGVFIVFLEVKIKRREDEENE